MQLQILDGERRVLSYALRSPRTLLGRSDQCDIALPSETISRVHCVLERRDAGWRLVDRSRHGTKVAGEAVDEALLGAGDAFELGPYTVRLVEGDEHVPDRTVTRIVRPADHEELLDLEAGEAAQVALVVADGPHTGRRYPLSRSRTRLGGQGAHVVLDAEMPRDAAVIRVVRGRALVEPGSRPTYLAGLRVREPTPVLAGEAIQVGEHVLELEDEVVRASPTPLPGFGELVGSSERMLALFRTLDRVSRHDATVLLVGESGTGKELAARGIHDSGARADGPFVALNCAALPDSLVESELFGHEAGAFTGAEKRQDGAFQRAHGGTIFLDEIGEMPPEAQAKLLRALSTGEVRRLGGQRPEFPDVRVVAATHRHLPNAVKQGTFRRDLMYRLAVLTVHLPALRHRKEDLGELALALLERHHPGATLSPSAVEALATYDWPGNVRELRNVLTRAVVLGGDRVEPDALSFHPWAFGEDDPGPVWSPKNAERERLEEALRMADGNKAAAARALGIPRTSLLYKMRKHGMA